MTYHHRSIKPNEKPETTLQRKITEFLKIRDWMVKWTHGNLYQSGFPDMYVAHLRYGSRWIEVKIPKPVIVFTPAQLENFPEFSAKGVGIWVITAATEEEYAKLFKPANWHWYLDINRSHSYRG
jgi:hypothetical protein